jgi:hypothetical protein
MLQSSVRPLAIGQASRDFARPSQFRSPCLVRSLRPRSLVPRHTASLHVVSGITNNKRGNLARQSESGAAVEIVPEVLPPIASAFAQEEPRWRKILKTIATTAAVAVLAFGLVRFFCI